MKVEFLGQPFPAFNGRMVDWLTKHLADKAIVNVKIASAWVKRSGLSRLQNDLIAFRQRGGIVTAVVGLDEGGATAQGLRLAHELFDRVHILHDPSSRTYHPKVYLASGDRFAYVLVGSNNMTAGGLYSNFEGGLICDLDLGNNEDEVLFRQLNSWFDLLVSDDNISKILTDGLYSEIISTNTLIASGRW